MKAIIGLVIAVGLATSANASAQDFSPRDECVSIEGGDSFRLRLATAVANRDADLLMSVVSPDILLDFGGGSGPVLLRERLDDPDYQLWEVLSDLQALGCGGTPDQIYLPWYWGEDMGTDDAYSTYIVRGSGIAMVQNRDGSGSTVQLLNWDVVTVLDDWSSKPAGFAHVRTASDERGFVPWESLRALVDYRLLANKIGDRWQITALVAGD